jgi:hypothetical protein
VAIALLLPSVARADWKQWTVAVTPAYAVAYPDAKTAHGGGGAVDVGFGLSDTWAIHARGLLSWHQGVLSGFAAMAGITYAIDVIRLQPTFDLSIGALGMYGGAAFGDNPSVLKPIVAFGIAVGFAIDYLWTRHIAIGVEVKYQTALVPGPLYGADRLGMYLYCGPRVVFRFGGKI